MYFGKNRGGEDCSKVNKSEQERVRGMVKTRESSANILFECPLKEKWSEKRMHKQFIRETREKVDKQKTWQWLSRGDLKVGTEALLCAAY